MPLSSMKYCIQCHNLPFRLSFSKLCEPLVSKQRCMRYLFLYYHTHCINHSKSAMLKLFSLHLSKFSSISGLGTKRIKPNVTWVVVVVKLRQPGLSFNINITFYRIHGLFPSCTRTTKFCYSNT